MRNTQKKPDFYVNLCSFELWDFFFSALAAIDLSVQHKNLCLISMVR